VCTISVVEARGHGSFQSSIDSRRRPEDNQLPVGCEEARFCKLAAGPSGLSGLDVNGGEKGGTGVSTREVKHIAGEQQVAKGRSEPVIVPKEVGLHLRRVGVVMWSAVAP
jgi:hypothetical protein